VHRARTEPSERQTTPLKWTRRNGPLVRDALEIGNPQRRQYGVHVISRLFPNYIAEAEPC
jgi:hypothetical protein